MARLRATASAARSVLDGREHDGMLDRVGAAILQCNKQRSTAGRYCRACVPPPNSAGSKTPLTSKQIAGTGMKYPSVLRQLHATRRPVQEPDADIFFQLPDRR